MFVNPILFGIIFNGLLKFILVIVMLHFALTLGAGESAARLVAVFVAACPIIGFVGSRILLDMIFTISLIAVIFLLIKAGSEKAQKNLFLATVFCCIFLNTKIQAIVYMPLFVFLYGTAVKRAFEKEELTYETFDYNYLLFCYS